MSFFLPYTVVFFLIPPPPPPPTHTHTHTHRRRVVCEFMTHFLLHSHGHQTLLGTLSLGVGVANTLLSNQYSSPRPPVQVESLKLVFGIIDLLLQAKSQQVSVVHSLLVSIL